MKNMVQDQEDEVRKGPWTEQEDFQLNCFVGLFGDRRWDFIAKVSGLNRTGKSCRLRWVNYLHPGLKRGKMTPQEERLVLELHSKWGNRWSRIARKLPGRTDNEIKNYWRTHMRKKAQEEKKKQAISPSSPLSSSSSKSISSSSNVTTEVHNSVLPHKKTGVQSFYDTGGVQEILISKENNNNNNNTVIDKKQEGENGYFMDDIWKEITLPEVNNIIEPIMVYDDQECCNFSNCHVMSSPTWDYYSDSLWEIDDEKDSKMIFPTSISDQQFLSFYEYEKDLTLTG